MARGGRGQRQRAAAQCGEKRGPLHDAITGVREEDTSDATTLARDVRSNGALAALDGACEALRSMVLRVVGSGSKRHVHHTLRNVRAGGGDLWRLELK